MALFGAGDELALFVRIANFVDGIHLVCVAADIRKDAVAGSMPVINHLINL